MIFKKTLLATLLSLTAFSALAATVVAPTSRIDLNIATAYNDVILKVGFGQLLVRNI